MDAEARKALYATLDRPQLERMAAFYREQVRLVEAEIAKHVPLAYPRGARIVNDLRRGTS